MTELTITPKTADKTARFRGAVAAGEHVAVTIKGGAAWLGDDNGEHLSLRVLDLVTGRTLAVFPRPPETYEDGDEPEEQDEWDTAGEDDADLFCNLNLNTDRMVNAARHMLRVPVLFVLGAKDEDNPATTRTLYFRDRYIVEFWPERVGDDTPYDLDKWPKQINEWTELIDGWTTQFSRMKIEATPTVDGMSVTVWDGTGEEPEPIEIRNGRDGEDGAPGQMTEEMTDARIALLATPIAHASDTDLHLRSGERAAWTAKYNKPQGGIPASDLAGAVQTSLGKADTALQEHQSLAAYVNGGVYDGDAKKILLKHNNATVAAIDATAFIRDGMISEVKIVGDNLVVVFNADAGKESISIPLTQIFNPANYYDKTAADGRFVQKESGKGLFSGAYADLTGKPTLEDAIARTSSNAVKSSGIWSAIWGALTSVPSGISSLYDWCKSFFAKASAIAPTWDAGGTYQVGDVCLESEVPDSSGLLYRCKKAYTATSESDAPSHDTEHWDRIDVLSLLAGKQAGITASGILKGNGAGGVTAAVAGTDYQAPLTIDATPTASSTNPVRSDGVKTALDNKVSGALSSGGWRVTNGQRDYVFASDTMADDESTIARIGDLRYPKHTLTTPAGAATLLDRAVNKYTGDSTFTSCTFTLPPVIDGQVRDFLLDVDNSSNASDVAAEFYNLGTDYALAVNANDVSSSKTAGQVLAEMATVDAGERARFYFTETTQQFTPTGAQAPIPVISIQRMTIEVVTTQGGS